MPRSKAKPYCPICTELMKKMYYRVEATRYHLGWYCKNCNKIRPKKEIGFILKKTYIGLKEV